MTDTQTSIGPVSLMADISIEIAAGREGWITAFYRAGKMIVDDVTAIEPWIDRNAPGRLSDLLVSAAPEYDKKNVRDQLKKFFNTFKESPDAAALISVPASSVIEETVSVSIERSDPPYYIVTLKDSNTLSFTAKEIATHQPITLNEKWLSVHPRQPLNATGRDFRKVIEFWLSIAEEVEPSGAGSPWEAITDALQNAIGQLLVHPSPEGLIRTGLYQEGNDTLWISNGLIAAHLRKEGKEGDAARFAQYLKRAGFLIHRSKTIRAGGHPRRAWGFRPDFRPADQVVTDFADLSEEEDQS